MARSAQVKFLTQRGVNRVGKKGSIPTLYTGKIFKLKIKNPRKPNTNAQKYLDRYST